MKNKNSKNEIFKFFSLMGDNILSSSLLQLILCFSDKVSSSSSSSSCRIFRENPHVTLARSFLINQFDTNFLALFIGHELESLSPLSCMLFSFSLTFLFSSSWEFRQFIVTRRVIAHTAA
jgi:hypothetical protein